MTRKGEVLHSLEELGAAFVPLPELPDLEALSLESLEAQAEKIRQGADEVRDWVEAALTQLDQVAGLSREARELAADKINVTQTKLSDFLAHQVPAYRRAAWLVLLNHEFSRDLHSREDMEELLGNLVAEGRLAEDSRGELQAYDKNFRTRPEAGFEKPEIVVLQRALGNLLKRVETEEARGRWEKAEELKAQVDISPQEMAAGKPGKCFLSVPPEKVENGDQTFWRGGGTLLVETDGQRVVPLAATGSIEAAVEEAKELMVHLLVSSIRYETPPRVSLSEEQSRKVQLLWHLVKRALRQEESKAEHAVFAEKATVSPEEFFLERKPGVCLVEFHGVWETPTGERFPNLFLLAERKGKKESTIAVVEVPEPLKDFFASCIGEKFSEEDNKFTGVGQPLRAVLQAIYGQTAHGAAKTARINGK